MSSHKNIENRSPETGSALVIAVIVLAILAALGIASLDVADMNMFIAANDRDTKEAFFYADSGANIGHEFLEESHFSSTNSTFYDSDANLWMNATNNSTCPDSPTNPTWGDCKNCTDPEFLSYYVDGEMGTYVRAGTLRSGLLEGSAAQIGAGYEGIGKSAAHGGTYTDYLIRSRRYGKRNSFAEVDIGWRHVNR
jgi:hypothetical protein